MGKILIIDDDKVSSKFMGKLLEKEGYDIHIINQEETALEYVEHNPISMILLDIQMPTILGIDLLREFRENYTKFELPIIMLTAREEGESLVECFELGANDYVTKPVNLKIALARVKTQLSLQELYLQSVQQEKVSTINSMITTYNHEINNPLAIAMGFLDKDLEAFTEKNQQSVMNALNRIADIVKKIEQLSNGQIEESDYAESDKMIKLK